MPKLDTEFFKLRLNAGFVQIKRVYENIPCNCGYNSFFHQYDVDNNCECNGTGMIQKEVKLPKPHIPDDFIEHMQKAYEEYLAKD